MLKDKGNVVVRRVAIMGKHQREHTTAFNESSKRLIIMVKLEWLS